MGELKRFGVSLPAELLEEFDQLIYEKNYSNRSEAIRDLIRCELVEEDWQVGNEECAGIVSLVYDHHSGDLLDRLTDIQHDFTDEIICNTHIHLDHHNCLEVIVLQGRANRLKKIADRLTSARGVKHGNLSLSTTGRGLK
ncbi:MAG: nickel-responsive transcriptional regulator NikR, partial [bacterium]